jgi:transposase
MTPEDRIRQVVGVVRLYHDVHGYGPTMTELAAHMGCSRSVAHKWTQVAEEAGLLQHTPASIRSRQRRTLQVAS